jgi:ureidoacrylate peracid hydrolase
MHRYVVSKAVEKRLLERQGKLVSRDTFDAARSALVIVDMQNHFVGEGFPAEVPISREIVPNINRLAKVMRAAGGWWYGSRRRRREGWSIGATTTATC